MKQSDHADGTSGSSADWVRELVPRVIARERRAVARALTEAERQSPASGEILRGLQGHLGRTLVVGLTGPPGAGKSTLADALVRELRRRGCTVGVIAVDPSSPVSGGAILGDRVRMSSALEDDGVFVRSLAARGHLGGLSPAAVRMIDVLDAAGYDRVLVETVGTGQSEIDIAQVTDVRVVVSAPGLGDEIQAMKSGLLEIADILVVNKGDCEGARRTLQQLKSALAMRAGGRSRTPVLETTATTGNGVPELSQAIEEMGGARLAVDPRVRRRMRARYLIARAAADLIEAEVRQADTARIDSLSDAVLEGGLSAAEAAVRLLSENRMRSS
ncbi:MAG: methylmalonyl Co-A mutase-associated GTPase MeaB [Hyphomicrobiaceae bacterium]|nr:methylmalonyl Co-A mutase-associated GTPase MeaB [Hyphomicrobiaceae bacterium]